MRQKPERWAAYTGVLAVVLWVVGIIVQESGNTPPDGAPDTAYLTHVNEDTNSILTGGWIFMIGCLAFLVFAVVLRERLAAAEGGTRLFTNIAFVGAVAAGAFGLLLPGQRSRLRSARTTSVPRRRQRSRTWATASSSPRSCR